MWAIMIIDILCVQFLSFVITNAVIDIYFIVKIFKDEFCCFSLSSLLTGEWDSKNLKTGEVKHHVASAEISKHTITIFLCLIGFAAIFDKF